MSSGEGDRPDSTAYRRFRTRADSLDWESARAVARRSQGFRVVISLFERRLWVIQGADTLLTAPVGVASGATLDYQGKRWSFTIPRGKRTIVAKEALPVWVPPEWHYYEVARDRRLVVRALEPGEPVELGGGRRLEIRSEVVGTVGPDSVFVPLARDEEIIIDGFLYIPPLGTKNRRIVGALGAYMLDLGAGYLLHGTQDLKSIGDAVTHGCVRVGDDHLAWLYEFVPLGSRVYIY